MKYKVTFKWTEEVTTTRQLILKADSKQHAEDLVLNSVEPRVHLLHHTLRQCLFS